MWQSHWAEAVTYWIHGYQHSQSWKTYIVEKKENGTAMLYAISPQIICLLEIYIRGGNPGIG